MVVGTETMNQSKDLLLKFLRAVLFGEKLDASDFAEADWKSIFQLADEQTVSALLLDGMSLLPSECIAISLGDKLKRIAAMQRIEQMNRLHRKVIVKIDQALKSEGVPVVFMKGQTTALRYPNPLHRTPGDIDFVVNPKDFKKTTVADIVFSKNSSNLALKKPCFCPGYSNKSQRDPTCSIFFLNFRAVSSKTILSSLPKKNIAGGASFFILCIGEKSL